MSEVFEYAVCELDSLLGNRTPWERKDHTQDRVNRHGVTEWVEYNDPGSEQYVFVEHDIGENNVVIGARISYTTFMRLAVDMVGMKITVGDSTSTRTVDLADLQDNRWYGGMALLTKPQTNSYLVQLLLARVVDTVNRSRSG